MTFRQHHVGAVVQSQVPAPLADTHRGDDALLQFRLIGQRIDQHGGSRRCARPDDQRQLRNSATFWFATTWPVRSISTNLPWFCQMANGRRSCR